MEEREIMTSDPPQATMPKDRTDEMSFLEHLEELRWHLIKGFGGVAFGMLIAFIFGDFLVNKVMLGPTRADFIVYQMLGIDAIDLTLQSRKLPGQFFTYWGTLIVMGGIIGSPIFFYQLWAFVEPALESAEKWKSRFNVAFITFFFLLGVSFGYFVLVPFAVQFFSQFQIADVIHNDFDINEYFSSLTMWVLSCGVIFQLPVLSYFLSKFGLLTPEFLRQYRKHAIVTCFIISAFLTPPDPVSQVLIAIPLLLLYQFSIWVSKMGVRQREKELRKAWGEE
ncbi:twin-arginine translocase subunit TatC [Aliifodinibius sp. S!AR15-10]|uniref:twin-arginine translocase subunit TatC n=1 Tax=Aliifodinibius sp. S!AR15-10 TaxID=2950437 RepID=UPI00286632A2|nr:twin-arginine translocase subunit TatC [Aliifodinibius sp. S!AR15-10]MDR8392739.1 twin-arginine translocase subunit TatC [Aliifodinibius sp. S!AR15-10]